MSLSKYFQQPSMFTKMHEIGLDAFRDYMMEEGMRWYNENPEEGLLIKKNLGDLGFDDSDTMVEKVKYHIILHYHEKMVPFIGDHNDYYNFLNKYVDHKEAFEKLEDMRSRSKACLITSPHFGAIEFCMPTLSMTKHKMNLVLKYSTPEFSKKSQDMAKVMSDTGKFGEFNFIELGKPKTMAALEMAAALRREEILFSVFDEKTPYSSVSNLCGRKVWGGGGLDKLLNFTKTKVSIGTVFMIRTTDTTYKMHLVEVPHDENSIQGMYNALEDVIKDHLEQWYFLHEEIPFVEES